MYEKFIFKKSRKQEIIQISSDTAKLRLNLKNNNRATSWFLWGTDGPELFQLNFYTLC